MSMIENTYLDLQCSGNGHLPQRPLPSRTRNTELETEKEKHRERQGEKHIRPQNCKLLTWFISIADRSSGKPCFRECLVRGKPFHWDLGPGNVQGIKSPEQVGCNKSLWCAVWSRSAAQSGETPRTAGLLSPYNPADRGAGVTNAARGWTFAVIPTA